MPLVKFSRVFDKHLEKQNIMSRSYISLYVDDIKLFAYLKYKWANK